MNENDLDRFRSKCCDAAVKLSGFAPDFIGDDPKKMKVGTCHYICTKCGEACDTKEKS